MGKDAQPQAIYLKDYTVPPYLIDQTELKFELGEEWTQASSRLHMRRNPDSTERLPLSLHGQDVALQKVSVDGKLLDASDYSVEAEQLTFSIELPDAFIVECVTHIQPHLNTSLEGLYKSSGMFCTQCEAEGFRKITYYLDRPDVMSEFTTTIVADASRYPVMLSNGNPVADETLSDGRRQITWHDPFKKPAYLFALVAGDLQSVNDTFTTMSGREVTLQIFVEAKDLDKCDHAMTSLKHSMRWDEEVYGREYDLDIFMIVAVDDFNMGAMENKGLNIFNTSCVLAKPETTTDAGFQRVEGVVAHEYFHNWSGNRVTCRDWFQLSLKEGFTVYRDQQFSADMGSPTVKRVEDVSFLRTHQFAEDAGPMAHPIRPASFIEISNFYTLTVYEKGSEVVRMLANLLGPEQFRRATDLYFERHDGQAVTTEDFVAAMANVSGRDLTQFQLWYSQAGTPKVIVRGEYNAEHEEYTLHFEQSCPPTPENENKQPMHIPIAMGLVGDAGALPLQLSDNSLSGEREDNTHHVLELTQPQQSFTFTGVKEQPVPALLRGASAPVKLHYAYSRSELAQLMSRESDGFCRWDAGQQLAVAIIQDLIESQRNNQAVVVDDCLMSAYRMLLADTTLDQAMVALMLAPPSEAYLAEVLEGADVAAIHSARQALKTAVGNELHDSFAELYQRYDHTQPYRASADAIAARSLKNTALAYLVHIGDAKALGWAKAQFTVANNMTDVMAALTALVNCDNELAEPLREDAIVEFYQRWQHESLVVNQWFSVQASSVLPGTLDRVKALMQHDAFDLSLIHI